ncbi:hypothetical protein OC834_001032 [Tilletia horrida]|uniref:Uncharacterized protein n=1 Tax=Tilletia horrida TaxID=155126 RepID=A0AAN6JIM5_9BASI|nr:hypothetical protein OC842_005841 [Tilletia horrida]KAK0536792.1 hypothetical protein OC834_001032 [Tilletia horrida]KAK0539241.1 hypothetical protein OC835_001188 [Tilletia horrida]
MAQSKNAKWCTFLSLCGDAVLTHVESQGHLHTYSADLYDAGGQEYEFKVAQWSRNKPDDGLYIFTNVPFATASRRVDIGDANASRHVPPEIDGSDPVSPSVEDADASFNGIGVIKEVSENRKEAIVAGFTFLNKEAGWTPWEVKINFEETSRWENWTVPQARSLVTFDAIVGEQDKEGPLRGIIRRLSYIMDAPRNLLQALGVGNGSSAFTDKKSKLRGIHAGKRARDQDGESSSAAGSPSKSDAGPSSPPTPASTQLNGGPGPSTPATGNSRDEKGKTKAAEIQTPPSPTLPTSRSKRTRSD